MKKTTMGLGVVALLAAFAVGCKEDLDAAKASLAGVTKERDDLSGRVVALQRELDVTKAELARQKARSTPVTADVAKGSPAAARASGPASNEPVKTMAAKHSAARPMGASSAATSRDRQRPRS